MPGPWERYQTTATPADGPWAKYATPASDGGQAGYEAAIASPEGQKLAGELRTKADKTLLREAAAQGYGDVTNPTGTFLRSAANTAALNIPRNIAAGIETLRGDDGRSFRQEYSYLKDIDEASARQSPVASGAGAITGAIAAAPLIPIAPAASLAGRVAQGAAFGAGVGGVSELADTKDVGEAVKSAGIGAIGGAVGSAAGDVLAAGTGKIAGAFRKTPSVPTKDDLKSIAKIAYERADDAGVIVNQEAIGRLNKDVVTHLAERGYHPALQPKVKVAIDELDKLREGNVTLKGLDVIRRITNSAKTDIDPSTRTFGGDIVEKIDDFMSDLRPSDIIAGNSKEAVSSMLEARKAWSSYRKADMIDEALSAAQLRASSAGSGGNIDNAIRQEFRKILTNPKKRRSFSEDEKAAFGRVVSGTKAQNITRLIGKLAPQGDGLRLMLSLGAAGATGGASLPVSALGAGAKALADRAGPANVERLSRLVRSGGAKEPAVSDSDALRKFFTSIGIRANDFRNDDEEALHPQTLEQPQ